MGGRVSTIDRDGMARSAAIDKQIRADRKRLNNEVSVLVLGTYSSGKNTIMKQMQILHQSGLTQAELEEFRPIVYTNVLDSAQAIARYIRKLGVEPIGEKNRIFLDKILDYRLQDGSSGSPASTTRSSDLLSPEIVEAVHGIWQDPSIRKIVNDHSSEFYLMDNAPHFLDGVLRIGAPDYIPTIEDVLQARQKHSGIIETQLTLGQLLIRVFDVGPQRSERKKWIHCFENVTSIIFCTALSDYDQEESSLNRMSESLVLFESVINSRWFIRTSVILIFTKLDDFKRKLEKVPLERFFPEYTGGADVNKATKYILWRFMQVNRARLSIYPHLMDTVDMTSLRLVFAAVKETILQNAHRSNETL